MSAAAFALRASSRCCPGWSVHAAPRRSWAAIMGRSSYPRLCCRGSSRKASARHRSSPARPWQNGVTESFNGKFRDECLSLEWFRSRAEGKVVIEAWRGHYK